ncbi:hypothetical protein ACSFB8_07560 [Enterococcus faecalis]
MDNLTDQEVIALFFIVGASNTGNTIRGIENEILESPAWYSSGQNYIHPTVDNFENDDLLEKIYDEVVRRDLFTADYMEENK